MESILPILLIVAMVATIVVLFAGIIGFGFNTRASAKYSTHLMTARVVLQGVAIAVFALMALLHVA